MIYLRPMRNKRDGYKLMNLATGQVITWHRVWEKPVTDLIIETVEQMATEQVI